jgi:hypothetical protein
MVAQIVIALELRAAQQATAPLHRLGGGTVSIDKIQHRARMLGGNVVGPRRTTSPTGKRMAAQIVIALELRAAQQAAAPPSPRRLARYRSTRSSTERECWGGTLSGKANREAPGSGGASPYLRRDFQRTLRPRSRHAPTWLLKILSPSTSCFWEEVSGRRGSPRQ